MRSLSDSEATSDPEAANSTALPPAATRETTAAFAPVDFLSAVLRDWKRIVLIALAAVFIAWSLAALQPPRYRASALAAVAPLASELQPNELLRGVEVLERRTVVATIAELASTGATRGRAAVPAGYEVQAAVLPNTNLVRVDVQGADAARAAAIANALPPVLGAQARAMYKYYGVTTVSPASVPSRPIGGGSVRAIAAGLILGLLLGIAVSWATQWRASRGSVR